MTTDPDLARLTAEMCGLKIEGAYDGFPLFYEGNDRLLWDPCDSIEQAFVVQERIRELGLDGEFLDALLPLLPEGGLAEIIYATPRQRVEAAVAAWKGAAK